MQVNPNCGAGRYFDHAVVFHNDALVVNSNLVVRMIIPRNVNISVAVVCFGEDPRSCTFVKYTISAVSCFGGNIRRKNREAKEFCVTRAFPPGMNTSPTAWRTLQVWGVTMAFNGGSSTVALTQVMPWAVATVSVTATFVWSFTTFAPFSSLLKHCPLAFHPVKPHQQCCSRPFPKVPEWDCWSQQLGEPHSVLVLSSSFESRIDSRVHSCQRWGWLEHGRP